MRVATLCTDDMWHFLDGIEKVFAREHEVRRFVATSERIVDEAFEWADLVWCEFANEAAECITREWRAKPVIVRLHAYEAFGHVAKVNWANVDHLVVTSQHILDAAIETAPTMKDVPTSLIPSAVDTEKFPLQPHEFGYRIGVVAYVRPEKNLYAALQILARLRETDDRWTLDVAGDMDHAGYKAYLRHAVTMLDLDGAVRFLGHTTDIAAFWREHDVCLSTSMREGHPYNALEAMACGVRPVIHEYPGARAQWPWDTLWTTEEEAVEAIRSETDEMSPAACREFVEARYSLDAQVPVLLDLIATVGGKFTENAGGAAALPKCNPDEGFDSPPSTTLCSLAMIAMVKGAMGARWLRRAIDSVRSICDELVVVLDDRSDPGDPDIPGVRFERRKFESFSDQRNYAASLCRGEWIFFVDADDHFEKVGDLRLLMEKAPDDVDRIQCIERTVDENGQEIETGTAVVAYRRRRCRWKYRGHNALVGPDRKRLQSDAVMVYRHPWDDDGKAHAARTIPLLLADFADDEKDAHAPYYLACANYMLERWAEVERWAMLSIKLAPDDPMYASAWFLLINATERLHGPAAGAQVVEVAIRAHPRAPDIRDCYLRHLFMGLLRECQDPDSPYRHAQQTRALLSKPGKWEEIAKAHGWLIKEVAA